MVGKPKRKLPESQLSALEKKMAEEKKNTNATPPIAKESAAEVESEANAEEQWSKQLW